MSFQTSNPLKNLESRVKNLKFSYLIDPKSMTNGDNISITFSDLLELDKIPGCYSKITKLNLSHNKLQF